MDLNVFLVILVGVFLVLYLFLNCALYLTKCDFICLRVFLYLKLEISQKSTNHFMKQRQFVYFVIKCNAKIILRNGLFITVYYHIHRYIYSENL